ncbi:hypothetical protein [Rhizobium leguminosarum]
MTKRVSIICLAGFIFCLLGVFFLGTFTGGVEYMHGFVRYTYNALWVLLAVLFLPGLMSYLFSRSWPQFRKNKANREFVRKNPLLTFFIWREIRDEPIDNGSISRGYAEEPSADETDGAHGPFCSRPDDRLDGIALK